jgi:hypothetical protein
MGITSKTKLTCFLITFMTLSPAAFGQSSSLPTPVDTLAPPPAPTPAPAKPAPIRVNGLLYTPPTHHDLIAAYVQDTYGLPGQARTTVRALYSFAQGGPPQWDQNATGFGIRMASNEGITMISGNVRLAMEVIFHEDLRYIPCRGCRKRDKLANALLAEITARHDTDGHRFFTLTPTVSDFSGPLIAHVLWYPSISPYDGFISARTVFATRIGGHLIREFILDRKKHKPRPEETITSAN